MRDYLTYHQISAKYSTISKWLIQAEVFHCFHHFVFALGTFPKAFWEHAEKIEEQKMKRGE